MGGWGGGGVHEPPKSPLGVVLNFLNDKQIQTDFSLEQLAMCVTKVVGL